MEAYWLYEDVMIENITEETRDHLVDLYFRFIHDKPHTLFHPTLLRKRIREDEVGIALLYCIMALAARFSDHAEIRQMTKSLYLAAKHLTKQQIEVVCLDNIHACILVGNLCGAEGEIEAEAIFFGVAFRMADICGFPDAHDLEDSVTKEVIVRTWCSLYMIDQWSSAGLNLRRQIGDEEKRPMDEKRFWRLKPGEFLTPSI
ncbi:uncharacterized protein N7477_000616 [Penicillium maclennaniae]|uniref:uncharacterized protein n=1 Tax=Penicillium maclennaniae TaxID=1343394 RepID=UPI00253F7AF0|nr:uncharacterized protein N7477_000616 [Penicillium maclennaniae]KAJ5684271.1 hypothetical protein N7477_000616 [Penicillium maclennaniae]